MPAAQKGEVGPTNPFAAQLASDDPTLDISGLPAGDVENTKPIFFAEPGDPETASVTLTTDWSPRGDLRWDGGPIPLPAGVQPATGSDGHVAIVSADRRTAWELWRCTSIDASGITAAVIAQWDLTGMGYSISPPENAARGSGTPIVATTLRADEALEGIGHALGVTVPHASSHYLWPVASHSDGELGPAALQYGTLFVLRPDYPVPETAGVGEQHVIEALKTYGAYVVDQGASFELDADGTHPELWEQTGLSRDLLEITADDLLPVTVPGVVSIPTYSGYPRPKAATPLYVPLVLSFTECAADGAGREHQAPLAYPSCAPATQSSPYLTVGTPDANRAPAISAGHVRLKTCQIPECLSSDVSIGTELTDVRCRSELPLCAPPVSPGAGAGGDYLGETQTVLDLRLTDKFNGPHRDEAATLGDYQLPVAMPCLGTPDLPEGSVCATVTTGDSLIPGLVPGGARTIWQMGAVRVMDGGADGLAVTDDNSVFAVQGLFAP